MTNDDVLGEPTVADVDDEPLGTVAEPEEPESRDITREPDPEDFDFDEFIAGVRPGRRAVRVTMRTDLMGERDQIALRAQELGDDDEDEAEALFARFREITEQIKGSQRDFVVEARSDARAKAIMKQVGPEPGKKASQAERDEWEDQVMEARLADAIVVPSNVTAKGLRKLREANEYAFVQLWGAFIEAQTNPTRGLGVDPNFLRGR